MERKIVQVIYAPHTVENNAGVKFQNYELIKVGDERDSLIPGAAYRICIEITKHVDGGERYVEVKFNDGTYEHIFDYVRVVLADEITYNRITGETEK